ncbi:MAG: hypothetical protein V1862_00885 [Methanobacteriota archaeon]
MISGIALSFVLILPGRLSPRLYRKILLDLAIVYLAGLIGVLLIMIPTIVVLM